jgi:adenylyltransferase/sulfurtransferase
MIGRDMVEGGHVPNTAVTASVIAALQVQEAIKILHDQPALLGEGLYLNGLGSEIDRIAYLRRKDCPSHEYHGRLIPKGFSVADHTIEHLLDRADKEVGEGAVLDLSRDVIVSLECPGCGRSAHCGKVLGSVRETEARCPCCGEHRAPIFTSSISRHSDMDLSLTLAQIGIPLYDILIARCGLDSRQVWLFDGDRYSTLGPLVHHCEDKLNISNGRGERVP